jgi:hypothetical protein
MAKTMNWEDASKHEMSILSRFVLTGWMQNDQENTHKSCLLIQVSERIITYAC